MQEFCLFALFGLGSDAFLQMFFFTTVLSIDIRRMEVIYNSALFFYLTLQNAYHVHDSFRQEA